MTQRAAYEKCDHCNAAAGQPCRTTRKTGVDTVHGQLRLNARRVARPHPGRIRNPNRVGVIAAGSRTVGGRTAQPRGLTPLDDES